MQHTMEFDQPSSMASHSYSCIPLYGYMDSSISSGSPIHSPSPTVSPFRSPSESSSDSNSLQKMSLETPCQQPNKANNNNNNTFVHKLFNMVIDMHYQHLIAWSYTGASFIVCNIVDFSRDVLPKHFKHNNFSSFVRQLNMYGFHKVNKSPRGHRTLAENQIWEFSHQKFMRDRSDLLDEIKRKNMETDTLRRDSGDVNSHLSMMQFTQADIMQQLRQLQDNFDRVIRELAETKQRQADQQELLKSMIHYLSQRQGIHFPPDFEMTKSTNDQPPSILITSPDVGNPVALETYMPLQDQQQQTTTISSPFMHTPTLPTQAIHQQHKPSSRPTTPLTVQTQNLSSSPSMDTIFLSDGRTPVSPTCSAYYTPLSSVPVSPNPAFLTDDDTHSHYSPHSPHMPHTHGCSLQDNANDITMGHISTIQHQQQQLQSTQLSPNNTIALSLDGGHGLG